MERESTVERQGEGGSRSPRSVVEQNVETVRRIFEEGWNRLDFSVLADHDSEVGFHYNGSTMVTAASDLPGLVATWRSAFPDLHMEIRHLIGDGDLVAVSLIVSGTHEGAWQGLPPSEAEVEVEEMMFFRFDGNTLVEMWEVFDEKGLNDQITESAAGGD